MGRKWNNIKEKKAAKMLTLVRYMLNLDVKSTKQRKVENQIQRLTEILK